MTMNREHFEAWLFSQPKDRPMCYTEGLHDAPTGCLMCNYFRENFVGRFIVGRSTFYEVGNPRNYMLPEWVVKLLSFVSDHFTIAEAQAEYLRLFPDTVPAPALPVQLTGGQAV